VGWTIQVTPQLGDLFFNSVSGYRAAFCVSREEGERANRSILDALASPIVDAVPEEDLAAHSAATLLASLQHHTAKIWVDEKALKASDWTTLLVQINHEPWVEAANDYLKAIDVRVMEGEVAYRTARLEDRVPLWGVRAPECELFEIKSAWIDPGGDFQIGKDPEKRAADIQRQGWS
jgi:hypothetical protein